MADIQKALADIMKSVDDVKSMEKSLSQLKDLKLNADIQTDLKALRVIERMEAQVRSLMKAKQELSQAEAEEKQAREEAAKSGGKISDEQKKKFDEASKREAKYRREVVQTAKDQIDMQNKLQAQQIEERELIMQRFKSNTVLGKGYSVLTGKVAEYGVKLGFLALSLKALSRFTDAAKLRNDLLIASYGKLQDEGLALTTQSVFRYESALRGATTTAIRLGMANEDVGAIFQKFQGIVGNVTPEALESLSKATLAVSKYLGITTAQALDYVGDRMDNFGGTASDALSSLYELRDATARYNDSMTGIKVRGDDVVRTISEITNSQSVYAVDQRYLSSLLMRTSANLQTQGESYNYAQRMAENYTKSLTSEAPEWMQITNAMDLSKVVKQNMDAQGNLTEEFAAKLDKAKPGLAKKVQDIMDAGYNSYDRARLIGETLKDTELGMTMMSKKIAQLGRASISILVSQYGKSYLEAEAMYKSAVKQQEVEKQAQIFKKGTVAEQQKLFESMKKTLNISDYSIELAKKDESYRAKMLDEYAEALAIQEAAAAQDEVRNRKSAEYAKLTDEISATEAKLKDFKLRGMDKEAAEAEAYLEKQKTEQLQLFSEIEGKKEGFTGVMDGITTKVEKLMESTSILTGDYFKAFIEKMSSPIGLAVAGLGVTILGAFRPLHKIEGYVYEILTKGGGSGGGYGDSSGGSRGRRRGPGGKKPPGITGAFKNLRKVRSRRGTIGAAKFLMSGVANSAKSALRSAGGGLKGLAKKGLGSFGKLLDVGTTAMAAKDAYAQGGFKGMAKSLAPTAGGLAGGTAGAAIGGALGTMLFPGVGTAIGAFGGRMLGDYLGSMATEKLTDSMVAPTRAADTMTPTPVSTGTPTVMAPGSGPQGSLGTLNPDGSITMTITNFMGAFAEANTTARSRTIRRS